MRSTEDSSINMKPGTRHFIGPLTPAQQRARVRSRQQFRLAAEIADARNIPMREALIVAKKPYGLVSAKTYWEHAV